MTCPPASVSKTLRRIWANNMEDKLTGTVLRGQSSCDWHTELTSKICQTTQAEASLDSTLDVMLKTVPNGNHLLLGQLQHLECNLVNDWIRLAHPQDLHVIEQRFNITGLRSCSSVMMSRQCGVNLQSTLSLPWNFTEFKHRITRLDPG